LVIDEQARLLLLNPAAEHVPGLILIPEAGRPINEVVGPPELTRLLTAPLNERISSREISLSNGKVYYASVSQVMTKERPVGKVCILRDITHFKEIEQLKQLKKNIELAIENNKRLEQFKSQILLDLTTEGLRIQIVDEKFLRLAWPESLPYTHFPAGEARDERTGGKLKRMGLKPGWPDFQFILPNGQAAFIELKTPSGVLSDEQIKVREKLIALRCGYATARDIEDVEKILTRWLGAFGMTLRARLAA
jgi:hypothetical protein